MRWIVKVRPGHGWNEKAALHRNMTCLAYWAQAPSTIHGSGSCGGIFWPGVAPTPLGQKIEAVEGIVPVRLSLVGRCAAIGLMQLPFLFLAVANYTRKNRRSLR